jgi:hypothetical protein
MVYKFHNARKARTGGEIQQPKHAKYLTQLSLSPFSRLPAELAYILLLAY